MFKKLYSSQTAKSISAVDDILLKDSPWNMTLEDRVAMTCACRDTDYIPKVKHSGDVQETAKGKVQIMHNGLKLLYGGYHGDWMATIIKSLKGHHEPQEEKAFYEVMQVLKSTKQKSFTMIELGSFWSYYSLWFLKALQNSKAFCFEPDPSNIKVGKKNAALNNLHPVYESAAAGSDDGKIISFPMDSNPSEIIEVKIRSIDSIVAQHDIDQVDILHMDVQGAELDALEGALQSITDKKIRFLFVSTHHYSVSKEVATHQKCLDLITSNGGKIIASHNVLESYSGDGLIVASFSSLDNDMRIHTSTNTSDYSLFRSYERDLQILVNYINKTQ